MQRIARLAAPLLATAAIALGGASSALAAGTAPASSPAPSVYAWDLDEAWCFDDVVLQYCFEVSGRSQFVEFGDRGSVVTNERFHTVVYRAGVQVGESTVTSLDRFAISADGTYVQQEVSHVRASDGDVTCSVQIVWRQADFETVVDHWSATCA